MSENSFPQMQQNWSALVEKVSKDNAAALEAAVDTSLALTKASLAFAAQVSEQWGKVATEAARRLVKTA